VTENEPRPIPKMLIWGLIGGFVLFTIILVVIVMNRERTPTNEKPHSSESRSESPPQ
jgi:hypothetical protein